MKPRRTPMAPRATPMKRTGFKAPTELGAGSSRAKSGAGSLGASPVKPRKAGRKSPEEKAARLALPKRSGGVCETQAPGKCTGRAMVVSHRKRRSQSSKAEKWSLGNLLHSCLPCEWHLTDQGCDPLVRSFGWTVHSSVDPAAMPVLRRGEWVWLLESGAVVPCDLAEIATWIGGAA